MADNENDNENGQETGKGLRAQLEAALAELATVKTERDTLATKTRSSDLATLLTSNKARAGADKLYPKDAEVTEAAVKAWVEENAAFVRDESTGETDDTKTTTVSDVTRANFEKLRDITDNSHQRSASDFSDVQDRMRAAGVKAAQGDRSDLDAIYDELGMKKQ